MLKSNRAVLVLILLLRSINTGALALLLPLYFVSIGRSASEWGLASGVFAFAMLMAEPVWGWACDRFDIVAPLLAGGLGAAILASGFAFTRVFAVLLLLQLARGLIEIAGGPSGRKALSHSLGPNRKATGIGLFQACLSVGHGIGPLLAGLVLSGANYPLAFALCSALSLLGVAVTVRCRGVLSAAMYSSGVLSTPPIEMSCDRATGSATTLLPAFSALAVSAASLFVGVGAGRAFLPLLGTSTLGLPTATVALILALSNSLGGLLSICTGTLSDRLGRRFLIVGGLLFVCVALLGCTYANTLIGLLISSLMLALGTSAAVPAGVASISDIAPFERQGRMIGIYGSCEDLGLILGSLLCGFLWDAFGSRLALATCGMVCVIGMGASASIRHAGWH